MKIVPNRPAALLLTAAMLLSILSAGTVSFTVSAQPEQTGQPEQTVQPEQTGQNEQTMHPEETGQNGQTGHPEETGQNTQTDTDFEEDRPDLSGEPGEAAGSDEPVEAGGETKETLQSPITPAEDIHKQARSLSGSSGGVTYETTPG